MPDLAQLIAAHEAAQPVPISARMTVLTPRGSALVAIERLRRQLATLEPADLEIVDPALMSLIVDAARDATA